MGVPSAFVDGDHVGQFRTPFLMDLQLDRAALSARAEGSASKNSI